MVSCDDASVMDDVGVKFARQLKWLRKKHGLTQEELAERADISEKHIQRLESRQPCGVRLVTLDRMAKAFRITLSALLKF